MGILKTRKNKQFSYNPRYFDDKGEGNPYKIESKFDKYRKTVGDSQGVVSRFKNAFAELKEKSDKDSSRRIVYIVLVLIFLFLIVIDFDLSIFFQN